MCCKAHLLHFRSWVSWHKDEYWPLGSRPAEGELREAGTRGWRLPGTRLPGGWRRDFSGWGRVGQCADLAWKGGGTSLGTLSQILTPFPASLMLHESAWIYTSNFSQVQIQVVP